ncbi:PTS sugar transporter subunit IIB [Enterococcus casseliflavus]|uniref:PTS sugar transporter subunit IIB n=1 Tax=Enterococcus casseliflavus TaxID=37734 RepID=UPI003D0F9B0C
MNRLIYDQLVALWANVLRATQLIMISNQVVANDSSKQIFIMVGQYSVDTFIINEGKAFINFSEDYHSG